MADDAPLQLPAHDAVAGRHGWVIEDDPALRELLVAELGELVPALSWLGFVAAEEALAHPLTPALAFVDVGLPGIDGIVATQALRRWHPPPTVVVMSVRDDDALRISARAAGAAAYLVKATLASRLPGLLVALGYGAAALPPSPGANN